MSDANSSSAAIVTGAGNGIGQATAITLASESSTVYVVDIDAEAAANTASMIRSRGGSAHPVAMDVASDSAWQELCTTVSARHHGLKALVNNAFMVVRAPADDLSLDDWDRQLRVNLTSVYLSIRTFLPLLRLARGSVVNVSSVHAFVGIPGHPAYAASKGGINALSRQLAVEFARDVRINVVVPGPIRTAAWDGLSASQLETSARATALLRLGNPSEVAEAIAFLLSDRASFITGSELVVDGGWLAKKDSN